jgi:ATP-binding cassette, subfamily B, bacterial
MVFFNMLSPLIAIISLVQIKKRRLAIAALYSVANKVCDIIPELIIGFAVDIVVSQQNSIVARFVRIENVKYQLLFVASITGCFWIFESVFEYLYLISWSKISLKVQHALHQRLYWKIQTADTSFIDEKNSGDLLSIIQDDSFHVAQFFEKGINEVIQLLVNIFLIGSIFFVISPLIAFMSLIPIPILIGCSFFFKRKISPLYIAVRLTISEFTHRLNRRLAGIITIKSYTTEQYEAHTIKKFSQEVCSATQDAYCVNALYIPLLRIVVLSGFLVTLVLGGLKTYDKLIEISFYATLIFLSQRFLWPFASLLTIVDRYEKATVSINRILHFLSHTSTILDGTTVASLGIEQSEICFDQVSFSYNKKAATTTLSDMSFCIEPKTMVAFVGKTGSGKSTIMKLLLRLYDVTTGKITLGRNDIRDYTLSSLRSCISFVSQEPYIIDGTIKDNITYGNFSASEAQIQEAAQKAILHDFILSLPEKYNTPLSESGKNLSGGQKQRIAIARSVLKNAPIILFDEVTSALDNQTRSDFQHSLEILRKQHTIIMIAHQLSTIMNADIIYVLENGHIAERGTHDELLAKSGIYSNLWNVQQ